MSDPAYLKKVAKAGNVGVATGQTSLNLCSIDLDDDQTGADFLELNPALKPTFRTKGRRGFNLWVRIIGAFPSGFIIKRNGGKVGEFRSNGLQTIVHGTHPEGMPYRWIVRAPALEVTYQSIVWFDPAPKAYTLHDQEGIAQRDRETEDTDDSEEVVRVGGCVIKSLKRASTCYTIPSIVEECLPCEANRNHWLLHKLNRGIRALELQEGVTYGQDKRTPIFDLWYQAALKTGFLRESRTEYLFEFMKSTNVKTPLGADGISAAFERAKTEQQPKEAAQFADAPAIQLLVALCYQAQIIAGSEPFFLSARKAASLLGASPRSCATWLAGLCTVGVLELVTKGGQTKETVRMASRFKYKALCGTC